MKLFHKTSAISVYRIHSGFQAFKTRVKEILSTESNINLDDIMDDSSLLVHYRNGDSADFVAAGICVAEADD